MVNFCSLYVPCSQINPKEQPSFEHVHQAFKKITWFNWLSSDSGCAPSTGCIVRLHRLTAPYLHTGGFNQGSALILTDCDDSNWTIGS